MANLFETWSLDREIVLVKLLNHPRDKVFAAWMDPKALGEWYGPAGFSIETHEADIREGGVWRFDMVGVFELPKPHALCGDRAERADRDGLWHAGS